MAGIAAVSTFLPSITSGTIFAPRRANKGAESNNAIIAAMNFGVAGGQVGNIFRGAAGLAKASTGELAAKIVKLDNAVNTMATELSKTDKIMNGAIKGGSLIMRNINPAIGAIELTKVAFSNDKVDAALTGGCAFGGMLLGEGAAKRILGLAKTSYKNGKCEVTHRNALYKKLPCYPAIKNQFKAVSDYLITKNIVSEKIMKHVPSVGKGILFASASIFSYLGGRKTGEFLSNNFSNKKAKEVALNQPTKKSEYKQAV